VSKLDGLVSVVIPTIPGREKELKRAVKSVAAQTYQNIEMVIVREGKNSSDARNIGISRATGQYVAFLDDDDEWLPTKLEKQLTLFDNRTSLVICWMDDRRFGESYVVKYPEKIFIDKALKMFSVASTSSYMFKKDTLMQLGNFDASFPSAQEYELAIRSVCACPIKCYQEVLVIQHKSENQITRDWKKKKVGLKLLLDKHKNLYTQWGLWEYTKFRVKFFGLQCLYSVASVVGDRIYKVIIPMKRRT